MIHIVVLLFTGIHNIAVHNLRQGQWVHKCFENGKCNFEYNICMIYVLSEKMKMLHNLNEAN